MAEETVKSSATNSKQKYDITTVDRLVIPFPRWQLCCPTVDETIYRITAPYVIPVVDTLPHKSGKDFFECVVTGYINQSEIFKKNIVRQT